MPDGSAVDHDARGAARDAAQLIRSHEALDEERFGQLRTEIQGVKESQDDLAVKVDAIATSLNQKMEDVKALIGSRPTWTVSMIISGLLGIIGFLTARAFPL